MGWLKDPLLLFLVLGAALAALHLGLRAERPGLDRATEIVVTDADVTHIRRVYEKTWQRPPTDEQVRALVERRVRDEMLYREAKALGLDQGDGTLRRRLVLKLEFLARDASGMAAPTEAELRAFFKENPARYARRRRRTFVQVFISEAQRGARAGPDAKGLLERLRENAALDLATLGDRTLLEPEHVHVSVRDVRALFGDGFAQALFEQPVGVWSGPLRSGYGLHLVLVREEVAAAAPPFQDVRDRLRRDLIEHRGAEAFAAYLEVLRGKYDVSIRATLSAGGGA